MTSLHPNRFRDPVEHHPPLQFQTDSDIARILGGRLNRWSQVLPRKLHPAGRRRLGASGIE
jgi:hypothetical protein